VELMGETLSFAPRKAIKSQALADFLAEWTDNQLPTAPIQAELWTMYFDGSLIEREIGLHLFLYKFWWLNCPTQIIGLTSLL
jgi:hypothetical protein